MHKDPSQDLEADAAKIYKRMDKHLRNGPYKLQDGDQTDIYG